MISLKASPNFLLSYKLDDTTLNSTLDSFVTNRVNIEKRIIIELQKYTEMVGREEIMSNVSNSKFMLFHMPQKVIPCLSFTIKGLQIENVYNFKFLGLNVLL